MSTTTSMAITEADENAIRDLVRSADGWRIALAQTTPILTAPTADE